jgi:hypothetical protein
MWALRSYFLSTAAKVVSKRCYTTDLLVTKHILLYECTEEINENEKYEKSEKQLMLIDKF